MRPLRFIRYTILILLFAASCGKEEPVPTPPDIHNEEPPQPSPEKEEPETPPEDPQPQSPYDLSVLDLPLNGVKVLTSGTWLQNASVMQSFVLPDEETMIACQVAATGTKHKLNVVRKGITSNSGKKIMKLSFFGHGSNMVHEEDSLGNIWLWVGCYATNTYYEKNNVNDVHFTNNQTVARVKFEAGKDLFPEQVTDQWYIPGMKNIHPALDLEARQIAFWCLNSNSSSGFFYVYDLDAALALPVKEITLSLPIIRGPSEGYSLDPVYYKVMAHNLGDLTPLAQISMTSATWSGLEFNIGNGSNQGFEIRENRIYLFKGTGNDSDTSKASVSYVTVLDFSGKVLEQRRVTAVASISDLAAAGITDYGFMESEGVKIYGDNLYLGYATKKTNDTHRYVTILEYPLKRKIQ